MLLSIYLYTLIAETHHLPDKIFITHNHGDHAAELPPLLFQDAVRRRRANKPKTTIYCGPEVEERLKKHRLNEISGAMLDETIQASPVCSYDVDYN